MSAYVSIYASGLAAVEESSVPTDVDMCHVLVSTPASVSFGFVLQRLVAVVASRNAILLQYRPDMNWKPCCLPARLRFSIMDYMVQIPDSRFPGSKIHMLRSGGPVRKRLFQDIQGWEMSYISWNNDTRPFRLAPSATT